MRRRRANGAVFAGFRWRPTFGFGRSKTRISSAEHRHCFSPLSLSDSYSRCLTVCPSRPHSRESTSRLVAGHAVRHLSRNLEPVAGPQVLIGASVHHQGVLAFQDIGHFQTRMRMPWCAASILDQHHHGGIVVAWEFGAVQRGESGTVGMYFPSVVFGLGPDREPVVYGIIRMSNIHRTASFSVRSNAGRRSRPLVPLIPWSS